jgi:hypothetical protein
MGNIWNMRNAVYLMSNAKRGCELRFGEEESLDEKLKCD